MNTEEIEIHASSFTPKADGEEDGELFQSKTIMNGK